MTRAFSEALVTGHRRHLHGITLPDAKDRHVVAAAIKAKCQHIVTCNLGDFPDKALVKHGVGAIHPDAQLTALMTIDTPSELAAIDNLIADLKKPPIPFDDFIEGLRTQALTGFCVALQAAKRTR